MRIFNVIVLSLALAGCQEYEMAQQQQKRQQWLMEHPMPEITVSEKASEYVEVSNCSFQPSLMCTFKNRKNFEFSLHLLKADAYDANGVKLDSHQITGVIDPSGAADAYVMFPSSVRRWPQKVVISGSN